MSGLRHRRLLAIVLPAVLLSFAPAHGEEPDAAPIRKAVEDGIAKWLEAFNRGDAKGVAAVYADDAMLLPPNGEIVRGKEKVQEFWGSAVQVLKDASLTTLEIGGSGTTAYRIGKYTLKVEPPGQPAQVDVGKYVEVWKRQADGAWKLYADIWNSSAPPP